MHVKKKNMDLVLSVSLLKAAQGITKLLVCMYCSPSMPNPKSHPETPRFSTWLVRGGSLVSGGNLPRWVRSPEVSLWWKKMEMQKIGGAFFWKHQFEGVLCVFGVEKAETKRKRVGKKRFGNEIAGFRNKFTKPIRWNPHTVDGPETLQTGPGTSKNFENQYFPLMVATFPLRFLSSKRLEVRWDCWKHQGRPFRTGRQGCSVDNDNNGPTVRKTSHLTGSETKTHPVHFFAPRKFGTVLDTISNLDLRWKP